MDFRVEADHTRKFKELCIEDESRISCPSIIDELTTERILTMTFVDGYSIAKQERINADHVDRLQVGKAIVENYLHQILDIGIFHGDPHQGNIMISHHVPYWIDFGMIGHISEHSITVLQEVIFSLVQEDTEKLANSVLSISITTGKVNKSLLMDDLDLLMERYLSIKDLSNLNIGALMMDLTALMSTHNMTMPGEYTMLVRSLVTIEGVLESFCPELNLFDFLSKKMMERIKESLDIREKLVSTFKSLTSTGIGTFQMPKLIFEVLRNLSKGRMKVNFELTGYEDLLGKLTEIIKNVVLALFACVLFSGSCTLCTTNIQPQSNGVPFVAILGFVVSIALAIYTISNMVKKK